MGRMETVRKISGETEWLQKRLDDNPHSILFARLADRYLDAGDINRAINVCDKGLEYYPGYATGLFVYAKCLLRKTEYEEAEKQLKKVLAINPDNLLALKLYGDLMAEMGWSRTAEECYKKIMDLDPLETNIRAKVPGSMESGQKPPMPGKPASEPMDHTEIDDKSIDNLFMNDIAGNEQEESIDTLFGGSLDEQEEKSAEPAIQEQTAPPDLNPETVDSIFGAGEEESTTPVAATSPAQESWDEFNDDSIISLFDKEPEPYTEPGATTGAFKENSSFPETRQQDSEDDMFLFGKEEDKEEEEEQQQPFAAAARPVSGPLFPQSDTVEEEETEPGFPVADEEEQNEENFIFPESEQEDFQVFSEATTPAKDSHPEYEKDQDSFIVGEDEDNYSYSPEKFSPERDRYSNILDGIFSPGLDEEERKDMETRTRLESETGDSDYSIGDDEIDQNLFGMGEEPSAQETGLFSTEEELEEETDIQLEPEDTILSKGDEARFVPSQPDDEEEEAFRVPDISESYLTFEEDENDDNIETEAVHMPTLDMIKDDADSNFETEEEELGNFLAGLGEQDDFEGGLPQQDEDLFQSLDEQLQPDVQKPGGTAMKQPPVDKESGSAAAPKDKFVTPTLGEIYAAQGQYSKAINVFELLLEKTPDNEFYKSKLEYLKKKQSEENNQ